MLRSPRTRLLLLAVAATAALSLAMYGWRQAEAPVAAVAAPPPAPSTVTPAPATVAATSPPSPAPLPEGWLAPPYSSEVREAIDAVADLGDPAALDDVMELADSVTALNAAQRTDAAPRF